MCLSKAPSDASHSSRHSSGGSGSGGSQSLGITPDITPGITPDTCITCPRHPVRDAYSSDQAPIPRQVGPELPASLIYMLINLLRLFGVQPNPEGGVQVSTVNVSFTSITKAPGIMYHNPEGSSNSYGPNARLRVKP